MPNPLVAPWTGPYGGVPAFDRLNAPDLEAAVTAAVASHLAELDAIASDPALPTFANTIVPLERAGAALQRVMPYYGVTRSVLSDAAYRDAATRIAPMLADHGAHVTQNTALFERVRAVAHSPELATLPAPEQRLVRLHHDRFVNQGVGLTGAAAARYAEIGRRLAGLYATFNDHLLVDEARYLLLDAEQLDGVPAGLRRAAAAAATARGHEGRFALLNTRSAVDPFLTYATDRSLREAAWRAFHDRGAFGDDTDTTALCVEILQLRAERAALLGHPDFATWILQDRMAATPERAQALLDAVWPAAVGRVREEVAALQALAHADGVTIAPWDYAFYADRLRKQAYALDSDEVGQYLRFEGVRDALFFVAETVFGLRFTALPVGAVPVPHPDVRVWEVTRRDGDALVGLFYLDAFAREGKRSGAWASAYRSRSALDGEVLVLASNNANFLPGAPGKPALLSWDDARILFHEFGHGLHLLTSAVTWPTLGGCVRDYVELQSQLLEHWLGTTPVIEGFLRHHATGAPMPPALVAKIQAASTFLQGFLTTEALASAHLDLALHRADPAGLDLHAFERALFARLGLPDEVAARHRSTHFAHIFSSEGYAAGYYGYLWADVLTADAASAFRAAPGGFYDQELAAHAVAHLFAPRDAVDPAEAYRAFRGRDADIGALMRERGFAD